MPTDQPDGQPPWRSLSFAALAALLWLDPLVRGIILFNVRPAAVLALVAGTSMVFAFRWGGAVALRVAAVVLVVLVAFVVLWPLWPRTAGEPPGATLRTALLVAVSMLVAYGAAYEMKRSAWVLVVRMSVAVLVAFVSLPVAVYVFIFAHIALGGDWL
jgi:hypothetical protein